MCCTKYNFTIVPEHYNFSFLENNSEFIIDKDSGKVFIKKQSDLNLKYRANKSPWFVLNDSKVDIASENDIRKLFNGNDSAYMLFYAQSEGKKGTISLLF